jgi:hypothetical protein
MPTLAFVDWLAAYEIDTDESAADLGERATLTVIKRSLDSEETTHAFIPLEPAPAGEEQREAILRAMAGRFPDARSKSYNAETGVASFIGDCLYVVFYEEHEGAQARRPVAQPTLFAV